MQERIQRTVVALCLAGLLPPTRAAVPQERGEEGLRFEGPVVVFVYPAAPEPDAPLSAAAQSLHDLQARVRAPLEGRKIQVVSARPALLRFGEDNPRKRVRQVDFRRTAGFLGTVVFAESHEPQIHQGTESEADLLARIDAYFKAAKKKK
jgi:hypothetical protein